jgi:hypothetical protein
MPFPGFSGGTHREASFAIVIARKGSAFFHSGFEVSGGVGSQHSVNQFAGQSDPDRSLCQRSLCLHLDFD